ncbi:DUF4843 domain-containing protein [Chitinophaga arvensicola]|uniref:DUF4843 domain-containing protein n=1 Tax=Chitinophaga arvensicola TaxID=29529 RepID=A0A1I0NLE3_9BACT|nr:DUF4843 domain-containing protein [Chitinophaga arvensicola]SEW02000.1 protein of unknown function [Chitinophaga arvensicola]
MQQIKRYLIALLIIPALMIGCKKQDLTTYTGGRYIQFSQNYQDTIALSFFLFPALNEFKVALPVELTGKMTDQDLPYILKADTATSAPASSYIIADGYTIKKGLAKDTARITIKKQAELKGKEVLLVINMAGSSDLLPGQTIYTRRVLRISDKISKPTWWDTQMDNFYLGKYSDKKFSTFIQVTGVGDLNPYGTEQKRDLMLQFKYYLIRMRDAGTPVLEDNGTDMLSTVPLIG